MNWVEAPDAGIGTCESCGSFLQDYGPVGVECPSRNCNRPTARATTLQESFKRIREQERPAEPCTFGLDFDGTFTRDPLLWRSFVQSARRQGHTVVMVTQRCRQFLPELRAALGDCALPVVFASGHSKEDAARAFGMTVDVWIEDAPYSVSTALTYRGCPEGPPELVLPETPTD